MIIQNIIKKLENIENALINLKVYCEFEKFFQNNLIAAIRKVNVEQLYKECKNRLIIT